MRKDQELTPEFRKNEAEEIFLRALNQSLEDFESSQLVPSVERLPTLHVIGVPRSGTTLLAQMIASSLDIGYVNNLIAAFWAAPICGIKLSNKLLPDCRPGNFNSRFGRTAEIESPHEFGYFWSKHLKIVDLTEPAPGHSELIDWAGLKSIIVNMTEAFGRPTMFKGFLSNWFLDDLVEKFGKACFVHIRRDPVDAAMSILKMREAMLGDKNLWVSLKPAQHVWLQKMPYWVQVAGQVYYLEKGLDTAVAKIPENRILTIELCDLYDKSNLTIDAIADLMACHGISLARRSEIDDSVLTRSDSRDRDAKEYERVRGAFQEFCDGAYDEYDMSTSESEPHGSGSPG